MIKGISDAIKQYFKSLNIPNAEKFYREAAVIFAVMEHQLKMNSIPKIIHFSSAVAFIKVMMKSDDFKKCLHNVIDGLICYQMDGSTPKEDRADIFENLKQATAEMATCLLQHSTCKEGINCPTFNVGIIARGMSEISLQQALGRIQRVADGKETAYLYIFVNGDEGQLAKLCQYLHYNLGTYEYSIAPITDDYIGVENDIRNYANLDDLKIKMKTGKVSINEYIQSLRDQDVDDEKYTKYMGMTDEEFFEELAGAF
jgi:superfamily II DNA or RNA helicase